MNKISLTSVLEGWGNEDLGNLISLIGDQSIPPTIENVEQQFKWLFHSKVRAGTKTSVQNTANYITSKIRKNTPVVVDKDDVKEMPSYDLLLNGALKQMNAIEKNASLEDQEIHLSHSVIIRALQKMTPKQRVEFFNREVNFETIAKNSGIKSSSLTGPMTTVAALGAAQLSGFGVYMAATTALGFLTNAVGITLPFAVYTGLTSSIAFVIGPVGWLGVGLWGAWKITGPNWKKIIPGLIYIISTNAAKRVQSEVENFNQSRS